MRLTCGRETRFYMNLIRLAAQFGSDCGKLFRVHVNLGLGFDSSEFNLVTSFYEKKTRY